MAPVNTEGLRPAPPSLWHVAALFALSSLLAALPFTLVYWPSQDGPNHLAMVHIVRDLAQNPNSPFASYFDVDLSLRSYMGQYYLLLALGEFVSLATAEKLVAALCILGWIMACAVIIWRTAPERWPNLFLALPLATGWTQMMGFTSFNLALPLGVVAIAVAWRRHEDGRRYPYVRTACASALLFLATFAHPIALTLVVLSLIVLELRKLRRVEFWLRLVCVAGPGFALLLSHDPPPVASPALCTPNFLQGVLCPTPTRQAHFRSLVGGLNMALASQATLSFAELPVRGGALLLLVIGLRGRAKAGLWSGTTTGSSFRLLVAFLVAYFVGPQSIEPVGAYMSERGLAAALITLPAVSSCVIGARRSVWLGSLCAISIFAIQHVAGRSIGSRIDQVVQAAEPMTAGQTLLPVNFDPSFGAPSVEPGRHAWGHIVMRKNVFVPYLFAGATERRLAGHGYRPLLFKSDRLLPTIREDAAHVSATRPARGVRLLCAASRYPFVLLLHAPPEVAEDERKERWFSVLGKHGPVELLASLTPGRETARQALPAFGNEDPAADDDLCRAIGRWHGTVLTGRSDSRN